MKKYWATPNCQNSEPMKRTVSILAYVFGNLKGIGLKILTVPKCINTTKPVNCDFCMVRGKKLASSIGFS
jgi:hypothetical protein